MQRVTVVSLGHSRSLPPKKKERAQLVLVDAAISVLVHLFEQVDKAGPALRHEALKLQGEANRSVVDSSSVVGRRAAQRWRMMRGKSVHDASSRLEVLYHRGTAKAGPRIDKYPPVGVSKCTYAVKAPPNDR